MKGDDNSYRATSHATFQLRYHLVLVTKYRRRCLTMNMIEFIKENAAQILRAVSSKSLMGRPIISTYYFRLFQPYACLI